MALALSPTAKLSGQCSWKGMLRHLFQHHMIALTPPPDQMDLPFPIPHRRAAMACSNYATISRACCRRGYRFIYSVSSFQHVPCLDLR